MTPTDDVRRSSPSQTVRSAFDAFSKRDREAVDALLEDRFVWTYFDPSEDTPILRTCTGRSEITQQMNRGLGAQGLELVEIESFGNRIVVTTRFLAERDRPTWRSGDLNFHVVEVRDGRIVSLRTCRDRGEADRLASEEGKSLSI